jgi:hypothetical protein
MIRRSLLTVSVLVLSAAQLPGCSKQEPTAAETNQSTNQAEGMPAPQTGDLELDGLSEGDRQLVLAQQLCPVSGEPLGSMGAPLKVTVGDRSLFICCAGCEETAKENFDEHYAKVAKSESAPQVE